MSEKIRWFNLGVAEKLLSEVKDKRLQDTYTLLRNKLHGVFEKHIQANHLQLHHYCQPRQNESMQGRMQFDEKNKMTLEPVIKRLEDLYLDKTKKQKESVFYLHLADANLDEISFRRKDIFNRLKKLTSSGYVKIVGGILDEAFIGPDSKEFAVAAIMAYYDKIAKLFTEDSIAPLIWIPERFFEEKTAEIIDEVCQRLVRLKQFPYIGIIVDENVIEHSLPPEWEGNLFSGWVCSKYPNVRIFVSSNHLRAVMPQASSWEINEYFMALMSKSRNSSDIELINWFIAVYEGHIHRFDEFNNSDSISNEDIAFFKLEVNCFYLEAMAKLSELDSLFVFFVDDLEKNGSWKGTSEFSFEPRENFYNYIRQAENIFNPYQMKSILEYKPDFKDIKDIIPSSYKEFSIIWNNNPFDVEKWREMTISFMKANINNYKEIKALSALTLKDMKFTEMERDWYLDFARTPISWQQGQLSKYPEIRLNYILAQIIFKEICGVETLDSLEIYKMLMDENSIEGNLLHIWNKNRASCPNFIGFFGGASILFFRLNLAFQLASVITLKYRGMDYLEKEFKYKDKTLSVDWTLIKTMSDIKIIDEHGDTLFYFNENNLHSLVSGFSRHREGYNSIIKKLLKQTNNIEDFALIDRGSGTTSAHPLVIALDLEGAVNLDIIQKTYPEDLEDFDNEQDMLSEYPVAWEQIWILPPNTFENPIINYQEGYFGDFKWLNTDKYIESIDGKKHYTFVRHALYQGRRIEVIKKIDTTSNDVIVEVWNRSNVDLHMNPAIIFPTSLDWFEGDSYEVENEQLPIKGEVAYFDQSTITLIDRISNLKLCISTDKEDVRYSLTTAYTYQTSDTGYYSVSPQHEIIILSKRQAVKLSPGEACTICYTVKNQALSGEISWDINWSGMPQLLKTKIQQFSQLFLQGQSLTNYQKIKLIYARYPEIIFWVK